MKIVRDDLPTEGVTIAGIRFKPGEPQKVDEGLAAELIERKGFKQVKKREDK
ncbi:MAG: hypothetical protein ACE5GY_09815 [Thermodesulfobacteriota bacterium]